MESEQHSLTKKMDRKGVFDGRNVQGFQYQNERMVLAWHINTWPNSGDPIEDYWVENGEFYEIVGRHFAVNMLPINRIETGRRIIEMEPAKRDSILNAIAEWEKPIEDEVPLTPQ